MFDQSLRNWLVSFVRRSKLSSCRAFDMYKITPVTFALRALTDKQKPRLVEIGKKHVKLDFAAIMQLSLAIIKKSFQNNICGI